MHLPKIKKIKLHHKTNISNSNSDLIIIFVDEDEIENGKIKSDRIKQLDLEFDNTIQSIVASEQFEGKWMKSSSSLLFQSKLFKRIALIGTGKKRDFIQARTRQLGIKCAEICQTLKANYATVLPSLNIQENKELLLHCSIGMSMGVYKYPTPNITQKEQTELDTPLEITLISPDISTPETLKECENLAYSINVCRLLQDGPPNVVTPKYVSAHFLEEAKELGLKIEIFGAQKLTELGFHAMLAVAGGSAQEPQFVCIEYKPKNFQKTIAFVGKGLTMDTGGYSIKNPSTNQEGMKYDMSGAAVTLSSILAIAKQKLPVHVYAIGALCENMIDSLSYRVGDVITSYSGKSIEVLNTDAEGRVVLADALFYAAHNLKPNCIVEYSTLTGAMVVTLGHIGAGVFTNNKEMQNLVQSCSECSGERTHPFPIWEEVADDIKGTISDLTNIGNTRGAAGSMAAAAFLNEFVEDVPYAHIDIAGVADKNQSIGYAKKGGSGYGVLLSYEIAKKLS